MALFRTLFGLAALSLGVAVTLPAAAQPTDPADAPPGDPSSGEPGAAAASPDSEPEPGAAGGEEDAEADAARPAPKVDEEDDDVTPEPPLIKPAPDTLSGHLMLGASALWAIPFGNLEDGASQSDAMSAGPGAAVDLGFGVSRTVVVGAWGQFLSLGGPDGCSSCSTSSMAGGLFVRYHIVQGMAFDPWMSAGLGYRVTTIDTGIQDVDYSGIEWLRLRVGGDWYPLANFGFGPYMELDMGRYSSRSEGELGSQANHWHFITGARVTFDLPGK